MLRVLGGWRIRVGLEFGGDGRATGWVLRVELVRQVYLSVGHLQLADRGFRV